MPHVCDFQREEWLFFFFVNSFYLGFIPEKFNSSNLATQFLYFAFVAA
jgi:hypothetical protein